MNHQIEDALNELINIEIWSANQYLSLQVYFEQQRLPILAHWLSLQAQSSIHRICRMTEMIYRMGGSTEIRQARHEPRNWTTNVEALNRMISYERYMDGQIASVIKLAEIDNFAIHTFVSQLYAHRLYVTGIFTEMLRIFSEEVRRRLPIGCRDAYDK